MPLTWNLVHMDYIYLGIIFDRMSLGPIQQNALTKPFLTEYPLQHVPHFL